MIPGDHFPLHSPRLLLRPVAAADAPALQRLYGDWEVARWLSRLPWPFTSSAADRLIADANDDLRRGSGCLLAAVERTSGDLVGAVSLRIPALGAQPWTSDAGLGTLGYSVARWRWGSGFASEAAACVVDFAIQVVGLTRLRARVLQDNVASRRVLERLGFTVVEVGVEEAPLYGGPPRRGDVYQLERQDWPAPGADRAHIDTSGAAR